MNNQTIEHLEKAYEPIHEGFLRAPRDEDGLRMLGGDLAEFANVARTNGKEELSRGADQLATLVEVAAVWANRFPDDPVVGDEVMEFVASNIELLESCIRADEPNPGIDTMVELANEAWSDYFLMIENTWGDDLALDLESENAVEEGDVPALGSDIAMLLQAVSGAASSNPESLDAKEDEKTKSLVQSSTDTANAQSINAARNSQSEAFQVDAFVDMAEADRMAREELQSDREMLDAFLDDSFRCVASMESAALCLEERPDNKEAIRAFCRELHTLKGASATVGFSGIASHLHQLENSLEEVFADEADADPDALFEAIDFMRIEMERLKPKSEPVPTESPEKKNDPQPAPNGIAPLSSAVSPAVTSYSPSSEFSSFASNDDSSIRIRAAHLDRLMDMLAELVVLRNRRENNASEHDLLFGELSRCSTRLSIAEEQSGNLTNTSVVGEVSKDIEAVARGFRSLQKPVANDNKAITRFIRDFRQELMQLRRVPVSGLFGRLQRAARDAAKTEKKQVRVEVFGENSGLEQEIQERLYESLLHVVRNSVSHGIQCPEDRSASGKDEVGTITLEASASAQLFVIEVRDDGNGVDYEAIRKRGVEKGLLASSHQVSNAELANLIFHPGFSTKETASEISGRGVGMDVVATTLEQLRGRIEVESVTGKGTTIRLLIPRRTGIEHVMVFRCEEQLYALPMQSIVAAKKTREGFTKLSRLAFSGVGSQVREANSVLVMKQSRLAADSIDSQIAITVDQLLGPEEVVVRGLPPMLRNHPLFCGITLSGSGEKVLLLESENVSDYCLPESEYEQDITRSATNSDGFKALVVDDSITARKYISKLLKEYGFATVEAGDGLEAIEVLHRTSFDLIVTDLDMPRLGGLELLADIENGKYCNAPIIVVSSRDDENFRRQALEFGACGYINKPVSKQLFQKQIEQLGLITATS